jgi:acyl-CoA thioesterase YciA
MPSQTDIDSSHPPTVLPDKQPTLRVVTMPSDTNVLGNIFGGWVMSQVDIAASIPAIQRARGRVATVAVNSFVFKHPIFVGDLVSFYADVIKVGRTSITVNVEVFAQRSKKQLVEVVRVTEATLTFVALDDAQQPRVVPPE